MKHLACLLAALAVLAAGAAALTALNARGNAPADIVVLTPSPSRLLGDMPGHSELRLVQAWAGGHVLHLQGRGNEPVSSPAPALVIRLPLSALSLMACG